MKLWRVLPNRNREVWTECGDAPPVQLAASTCPALSGDVIQSAQQQVARPDPSGVALQLDGLRRGNLLRADSARVGRRNGIAFTDHSPYPNALNEDSNGEKAPR